MNLKKAGGERMNKIYQINDFANQCGYFFNACLNTKENFTCNNGYNCRHPQQEEKEHNSETGNNVGMCYAWSCPLGYEADEEDFDDPDIDNDGYQECEEGEFIVADDKKLLGLEPMKAITLWQPWASLTILGEKLIETRSWYTTVRGRVGIHAAKSDHSGILLHIPMNELAFFQAAGVCGIPEPPLGAVVGTIEIEDCIPIEKLYGGRYDTPKERAFGDWTAGRFGWIMKSPVAFEKPVPAKGAKSFWNWEGRN